MSDIPSLLSRIAALRERLEEAKGPPVPDRRRGTDGPLAVLERQAALGAEQNALLDAALRQLPDTAAPGESEVLPTHLTARARRILERGRELLGRLRELGDTLEQSTALGLSLADDPLTQLYRETAAMAGTTLRTVQAFPDAPSIQLRLCEGLEAILGVIAQRLTMLGVLVEQRRREADQVARLADLLETLALELEYDVKPFIALAEEVLAATHEAAPLRFVHAAPNQPARFVACHSLNVAQVVARVVRHDPELRGRPLEPVLAALVHDVAMLNVPPEVLAGAHPLNDEARRLVEAHCRIGAGLASRLLPNGSWLAEAVAAHHERLDGTGYPDGLRELQLSSLVRLLAVCDVYTALCSPRPHRSARETRTALTDTLLLAEQGQLDRFQAEHLLQLSFYPAGTVVELAEGNIAVVLATHGTYHDLNAPSRPVVAVLTDRQGRPVALPRYVDLARCEGHSIVRTLAPEERRRVLGRRYPEFV
jgi:HD-GYP domain-containing protein (c-di-GMP phosphodiesterase class II)